MPITLVTLQVQNGDETTVHEDVFRHKDSITIGRGQQADIPLSNPTMTVSRRHCLLERVAGEVLVRNLSVNNTLLNADLMGVNDPPRVLSDGDELFLSPIRIAVTIRVVPSIFEAFPGGNWPHDNGGPR